ncbi:MAG TPA: type IV pilus secretin PilQ [Terriglobia bacterium]|nr:type IV pilus secretin PilQ [Terriglobia bacterium]
MRVDSRKFLTVGVLLLVSTLAVNGASSRESAVVKDVSYQIIGDSLEVKITATGDSRFTYFELNGPHRLVVDFHGIQNTIGFKEKQIDAGGVERVRTSFFNDKNRQATRIVFDLKENVQYHIVDDGSGLVRLVFGAPTRAPSNLTAGPAIAPPPSAASAIKLPTVRLDPGLFQAEPKFELPQLAARPVVEIVQNPAPKAIAAVAQAAPAPVLGQTQITIVPPTPPQVPATTPTVAPQYNGELISLDLKDYDIKDFFRLISELSGLNVVLDPNVNGTITLKMIEVPWDQALDVVLKNYQLGGQLQGNVLRIATNATLQAEEGARKALRDAQDLASPLLTRTFVLNYTKATDVATTLGRLLSPRGTIIQDARKNALIVTDIPTQFTKLDDMVRFLDTPQQQVEIEARLLSAVKSFSRDLGNQLGLLIGNRTGNVLTGVPGTSSPFGRTPPPRVATGSGVPLVANFPAGGTSGLSFLLQAGGDILLDEIITAAETRGTAKTISRPKVITQNNIAATVSQGTQIPVQTNVNNTISVQFISFTLNLTVTPQITDAGTILLTIGIENSQPDFGRAVNGIPSVSTQRAQTQLLLPDGGTAVIGGILIDLDSINISQVPGLGSLPIIGNLFKSTQTVKNTSELLFFVTPHIRPMDSLTQIAPGEENAPGQPR